jgi:RND family efflux transporter MFP subunit
MSIHDLQIDRTRVSAAVRRRRSPWPLRVIGLVLAGAAVWLFRAPLEAWVDRVRLPSVRIAIVSESHPATAGAVQGTAAAGHIVAARRAALSADTPGRVVEMNVTEGSVVRRGDVVARLYADEYAAALRGAEAELAEARVQAERSAAALEAARAELLESERNLHAEAEQVAEAKANEVLARLEFERQSDLVESGVASRAVLDVAKANLDASAARLRGAEARQSAAESAVARARSQVAVAEVDVRAAEAEVTVKTAARDLAKATLAKTEIRAPFDGIVVLKDAEVGEVVSPNSQSGSNARGSICTLVDLDSLEAQAEVPETSLPAVAIGSPVSVFLDAYPEKAYRGRVTRIWPTANRQKATVEVRMSFDEPDGLLRPEMSARIVFAAAPADGSGDAPAARAILVSEDAIVASNGQNGVFVLEQDTVRFVPLELGERRAGRVAVLSGLAPGQRIVIDPPSNLRTGDRVRVEGT